MDWSKKIAGLKKLIGEVGSLWPFPSTELAGYAEDGPYHCEDCIFLKGHNESNIFRDENGKGLCNHAFMMADPKTKKDEKGLAIVNIEKGCCEFVDPGNLKEKEMVEGKEMTGGKKRHKFTHTHVELHDDGSASIHHVHESGPDHDVHHAVGDLDGVHDSFQEHLNPEEEERLEEKIHPGIHQEMGEY